MNENPMQYQLLPSLSAQEYEALKTDIAARGVMVPVEKDESGNILDGFHRSQICAQLGITDYPVTIRCGMTHDEKVEHALTLNFARRHLNAEQRRELILKLRQETAWSNVKIADIAGVREGTVRNVLEAGSQICEPDALPADCTHCRFSLKQDGDCGNEFCPGARVTGKDGKSYPAKRAPRTITAKNEQQADTAVKLLDMTGLMDGGETNFTAGEVIADANKTLYATNANRFSSLMSSESYEWYTPEPIVERVRLALGRIDLDPCSSGVANATVKAAQFFTEMDSGLTKRWDGNIYMNPPYGDTIGQWVDKLVAEHGDGRALQAVALLPARTDTVWFRKLRKFPRCFLYGRLKFGGTDCVNSAPFPSVLVALGCDDHTFADVFSGLGDTYSHIAGGVDGA